MLSSNARLGLRLFAVYTLFYGAFVVVNAFAPEWTEATPLAGLNAAVLGGFGLIALAMALSLAYGVLATNAGPADADSAANAAEGQP